jgi:hypothetical protein
MLPDICIASHLAILLGFCMIGYLAFIFSLIHSIANIVYCMRTENIESVMCNGRWIMKDHKIMNLNEVIYCLFVCTSNIEMNQKVHRILLTRCHSKHVGICKFFHF